MIRRPANISPAARGRRVWVRVQRGIEQRERGFESDANEEVWPARDTAAVPPRVAGIDRPFSFQRPHKGPGSAIARPPKLMCGSGLLCSMRTVRLSFLRISLAAAAALCLAMAPAACSHASPVAPAQTSATGACSYLVSPIGVQMVDAGGTFQVSINPDAANECLWTVSASDAWITPVGTASGQGAGVVVMEVASLPSTVQVRNGLVTVGWTGGSKLIAVRQGCPVTSPVNVSAEGQEVQVGIGTSCSSYKSLSIDAPWIQFHIVLGKGGITGAGAVVVDRNTGPERIGHVTTEFFQLTIVQAAGGPANCVTAITPTSQAFNEDGGTGTINVTAA